MIFGTTFDQSRKKYEARQQAFANQCKPTRIFALWPHRLHDDGRYVFLGLCWRVILVYQSSGRISCIEYFTTQENAQKSYDSWQRILNNR